MRVLISYFDRILADLVIVKRFTKFCSFETFREYKISRKWSKIAKFNTFKAIRKNTPFKN